MEDQGRSWMVPFPFLLTFDFEFGLGFWTGLGVDNKSLFWCQRVTAADIEEAGMRSPPDNTQRCPGGSLIPPSALCLPRLNQLIRNCILPHTARTSHSIEAFSLITARTSHSIEARTRLISRLQFWLNAMQGWFILSVAQSVCFKLTHKQVI